MTATTSIHLNRCLQRLRAGDADARSELLSFAGRRLRVLAERIFFRYPQLRFREQADDLLQESTIRLWKSLEAVNPETVAEFMGLAALQMRRALRDLARSHFGRTDHPKNVEHGSANLAINYTRDDANNTPDELLCWSDFHLAVDRLPEPYRTTFDLIFYHDIPKAEVAVLMNISERQVHRQWQAARIKLRHLMKDSWPEL